MESPVFFSGSIIGTHKHFFNSCKKLSTAVLFG